MTPTGRGSWLGVAVGGQRLPGGACGLGMGGGCRHPHGGYENKWTIPRAVRNTKEFGGEAVGRVSKVERVSIFIPILSCPHPSPISVALKREASGSAFTKTRSGKRISSSSTRGTR